MPSPSRALHALNPALCVALDTELYRDAKTPSDALSVEVQGYQPEQLGVKITRFNNDLFDIFLPLIGEDVIRLRSFR